MLNERNNKYQHLLCSVILDRSKNRFQTFQRGDALTIFENCTDFWNGKEVVPVTDKISHHVKDVLEMWMANDFDPIGFSYKPVTPDVESMVQARGGWSQIGFDPSFDKKLAQGLMQKQIFLGMLGLKNHRRIDAKEQVTKMDKAGIRSVLFNREGVLETKAVG